MQNDLDTLTEINNRFFDAMNASIGQVGNAAVMSAKRDTNGNEIVGKTLDNKGNSLYNNIEEIDYERTDEFRRIQEANQRAFNKTPTPFQKGSREINEALRTRLSDIFRRELERSRSSNGNDKQHDLSLDNGKGETFNIYQNADPSLLHDIFEISRNYLENGELVDLHPAETTEDSIGYADCDCYISDDGLSGFAITPDEDLISVFNANFKKGFLRAISPVVKEKALTLDCYMSPNQPLSKIYNRVFGFKSAPEMEYNMEYDHDDIAKNHSMPKISFMVNTDEDVVTKQFGKDEYDEAVAYRDSFIKNERTVENDSAFSDVQNSFSMKRNVEETKDLIAVHNMTAGELEKTFSLGGFPMPSIAILKAQHGHSEYGPNLLFSIKKPLTHSAAGKTRFMAETHGRQHFPL